MKDIFIDEIADKLSTNLQTLQKSFIESGKIKFFYLDNLISESILNQISAAFDKNISKLFDRKSLRENKKVGVKYDHYDQILSDFTAAIHSPRIIELISHITELDDLEPDSSMYAAGLSSMGYGNFLNPHLDNSHNFDRSKYRCLNLLYYCTPNWDEKNGGNLELWPEGPQTTPLTIASLSNRLVVMKTDRNSWHSVSKVIVNKNRNCISNYYFSKFSPDTSDYNHVTSFRGNRDQKFVDIFLKYDAKFRNLLRKVYKKQHTRHIKD